VVIDERQVRRIHLHLVGVKFFLLIGQLGPLGNEGVAGGQFGAFGTDSQLDLLGQSFLAIIIPAGVKGTFVLGDPFLRAVVRCVAGAGAVVQEERAIRRHLFQIGDELLGLVRQVGDVVIAFLRRFRRFDEMVVVGKPRIILIGVAAQEAIIA